MAGAAGGPSDRSDIAGRAREIRLATEPPLRVGNVELLPPTRQLRIDGTAETLEPLIMSVLVVLARANGQVVSRDRLIDLCWGGRIVGDDAINRVIGRIRRIRDRQGRSLFPIETITKVGYRLARTETAGAGDATGAVIPANPTVGQEGALPIASSRAPIRGVSRRRFVAGAGAAAAGGAALLWLLPKLRNPRAASLMDQAEDSLRRQTADLRTVRMLEEATAIAPASARAWGLLGLSCALVGQDSDPTDAAPLLDKAEKAAQRALKRDAREPNALLAMFELQGSTLDWFTRDRRLRQILAIDSDNVCAIAELALFTQATGMVRESWDWNERALSLQPLVADFLVKRALKLWILGRTAEADKVIDQVRALHPHDHWPWYARLHIYTYTGRAQAALAMLDSEPAMARLSPPMTALLRAALPALDQPTRERIARAREACVVVSQRSPRVAYEAVAILCALGDADSAFSVAEGILLSRGSLVPRQPGAVTPAQTAYWRISTQWMFTPPVVVMRRDRRFLGLCKAIGLTDYWRKRGREPDGMKIVDGYDR